MTTYTIDPFTQLINRLWEILESDARFTARFRLKNRKKLQRDTKDIRSNADLEELELVPVGSTVGLKDTWNRTRVTQRFALRFATEKPEVDRELFPIKWILVTALAKSGADLGLSFVYNVNVTDNQETLSQTLEFKQGKSGWTGSLGIEVEMNFHRLDD